MRRIVLKRLVCAALCATCLVVPAGSLQIVSQNALHYGWGSTNPSHWYGDDKVDSLWGNLSMGQVGLMQEVMPPAKTQYFKACKVGTCKVYQSSSYGWGWYLESYYFFVMDEKKLKPSALVECRDLQNVDCSFSRPPASLLLAPADSKGIWLANFHAIWGKHKSQRIAEAKRVPGILDALLATGKATIAVIGGDWNLTTNEVNGELGCKSCSSPSDATTLKQDGSAVSSSYDHFAAKSGQKWLPLDSKVMMPPSKQYWRDSVSDHLGVTTKLGY